MNEERVYGAQNAESSVHMKLLYSTDESNYRMCKILMHLQFFKCYKILFGC